MKRIKFLISLLFVGLFGFIGFGNCFYCSPMYASKGNVNGTIQAAIDWNDPQGSAQFCLIADNGTLNITVLGQNIVLNTNEGYCVTKSDAPNGIASFPVTCATSNCVLGYVIYGDDCNSMSSLECQTEYNLIPVSSVDQDYCVNNGLCPSCECSGGSISGDNWSALYINDIQHIGAPIIDITIPEEFDWDYTSTDELFELDVKGYNTDSDYIAGVIDTQKSTPNNQDFNNIITGIIPLLIPGLVIILFIYFIFRFVKKIF